MTLPLAFTRFQGDSFRLPIAIKEDDGVTPVDISGCSVRFTLGTITQSTAGVTVTVNGPNGTILIDVPYGVMATLTGKDYKFDVEVTYADGFRETLFVATLTLEEDVTK